MRGCWRRDDTPRASTDHADIDFGWRSNLEVVAMIVVFRRSEPQQARDLRLQLRLSSSSHKVLQPLKLQGLKALSLRC